MENKITGDEQAFPTDGPGMSYRQWLVGHIAASMASGQVIAFGVLDEKVVKALAASAIEIADKVIGKLNERVSGGKP